MEINRWIWFNGSSLDDPNNWANDRTTTKTDYTAGFHEMYHQKISPIYPNSLDQPRKKGWSSSAEDEMHLNSTATQFLMDNIFFGKDHVCMSLLMSSRQAANIWEEENTWSGKGASNDFPPIHTLFTYLLQEVHRVLLLYMSPSKVIVSDKEDTVKWCVGEREGRSKRTWEECYLIYHAKKCRSFFDFFFFWWRPQLLLFLGHTYHAAQYLSELRVKSLALMMGEIVQ